MGRLAKPLALLLCGLFWASTGTVSHVSPANAQFFWLFEQKKEKKRTRPARRRRSSLPKIAPPAEESLAPPPKFSGPFTICGSFAAPKKGSSGAIRWAKSCGTKGRPAFAAPSWSTNSTTATGATAGPTGPARSPRRGLRADFRPRAPNSRPRCRRHRSSRAVLKRKFRRRSPKPKALSRALLTRPEINRQSTIFQRSGGTHCKCVRRNSIASEGAPRA